MATILVLRSVAIVGVPVNMGYIPSFATLFWNFEGSEPAVLVALAIRELAASCVWCSKVEPMQLRQRFFPPLRASWIAATKLGSVIQPEAYSQEYALGHSLH